MGLIFMVIPLEDLYRRWINRYLNECYLGTADAEIIGHILTVNILFNQQVYIEKI